MKRIMGIIFILLCMVPVKLFAETKVKVYVFEAGGCPACESQIEYLKGLEGYDTKFEVIEKELYIDHIEWKNGKDYALGKKVADEFNRAGFDDASSDSTPFVVISDVYAASAYSNSLESIINSVYISGDKDIVGCYENGNTYCGLEIKSILDNDVTLKSLVISIGDLDPAFDKEKTEYNVTVRGNVEEVNVNAECNGKNCKVYGTGSVKLIEGKNEVVIKVTAENNDEQYYRVYIYREENYYKHLYIGVAGALAIIIITLIGLIWSITKSHKNK